MEIKFKKISSLNYVRRGIGRLFINTTVTYILNFLDTLLFHCSQQSFNQDQGLETKQRGYIRLNFKKSKRKFVLKTTSRQISVV